MLCLLDLHFADDPLLFAQTAAEAMTPFGDLAHKLPKHQVAVKRVENSRLIFKGSTALYPAW